MGIGGLTSLKKVFDHFFKPVKYTGREIVSNLVELLMSQK